MQWLIFLDIANGYFIMKYVEKVDMEKIDLQT